MGTMPLINDLPISKDLKRKDAFNFSTYAKVLGNAAIATEGPFTIGVFGDWGTGKTSLLKCTQKTLIKKPQIATVWFNAWRYEREEHPIVPLISKIKKDIEENQIFCNSLEEEELKNLSNILSSVLYGLSVKIKASFFGTGADISMDGKKISDKYNELGKDTFWTNSFYSEAYERLSELTKDQNYKIIVFIDDLDRCLPDSAIKLLESIKLILSQPNFIFFIGVSREILEGYLNHIYKDEYNLSKFDGASYLDKIIQLPFDIPPHISKIKKFTANLSDHFDDKDKETFENLLPIISLTRDYNPRSIIRFINNLLIDREVNSNLVTDNELDENIPIELFAVTRILQQRWRSTFLALARNEKYCSFLSQFANAESFRSFKLEKEDDIQLLELIDSVRNDHRLLKLLLEDENGKSWLNDNKKRIAAIEFLKEQRDGVDISSKNALLYFTCDKNQVINSIPIVFKEFEIDIDFLEIESIGFESLNYYSKILLCFSVKSLEEEDGLSLLETKWDSIDEGSLEVILGFIDDDMNRDAIPNFLKKFNYFFLSKGVEENKIQKIFS